VSSIFLFYEFHDGSLPTVPQPAAGRIYPSNNHGSIVYLTRSEMSLLELLQFGSAVPFFAAFFVNRRWRVFVDPLEGLTFEQRYKVLHGRVSGYRKARESYDAKDKP
jgi:hypothetical protein